MLIPLVIGKYSNGEEKKIDLSSAGLLMVSYSEEEQLQLLFKRIIKLIINSNQEMYLVSNTRRYDQWQDAKDSCLFFLRNEPALGTVPSRFELLKMVWEEIKKRKAILKRNRIADFKRYYALNTWNKEKLPYCFIVIDDIWDIITSKPKSLSLNLMRIILYGPDVGVQSIIASGLSYRNLLQQLTTAYPVITKELIKKYGKPEPKQMNMLGDELIITPEELIFYRHNGQTELERYFKPI
jgi:hypothetical protein